MTDRFRGWTPAAHITRAEVLLADMDSLFDEGGNYTGSGAFVSTPIALTLAQTHIAMAEAKMRGRQRA